MKYKVMYTAGAKKDLRNIFRYISEELLAPENTAEDFDSFQWIITWYSIRQMMKLKRYM